MAQLNPTSKRFRDAASALGLDVEVHELAESSRTAEEAAAACGCAVGQIVKSLVFKGADSERPILLLVSGANRVDQKGVAKQIGEALVRPDAQFVRDVTGYAIGGIPPLGHKQALTTYIDEELLDHDTIWAAAGTPNSVFPTTGAALREAASAKVIGVK